MSKTDRLAETQFTYKTTKDGKLFVYWHGKHVRTYSGLKAAEIVDEIAEAESDRDVQLALARVTGNFKRGERRAGLVDEFEKLVMDAAQNLVNKGEIADFFRKNPKRSEE